MKRSLALVVMSALPAFGWLALLPQAASGTGGATVGYVHGQRLSSETEDGRKGAERLRTAQRDLAADIRTKQAALETTRAELLKAPPDDRARLQQQEQQQRQDLERTAVQGQAQLQTLQRQISSDVVAKARVVIDGLMKDEPIRMVLNADAAVVWASPELDLTDEVIARMNAAPPPPQ
jgi:Skp family chaperone for outer membrane proteins